jgi:hypothetical protein
MKKCPYCAEEIQSEAIVCRYCGRDLTSKSIPTYGAASVDSLENKKVAARTQTVAKHQIGYIEQNLTPGEQITLRAKMSWAMFFIPTVMILLGIILSFSVKNNGGCAIAFLIFVVGLIGFFQAIITYSTTEFAVTNKRVIAKTGLIRRRSLELMLTKVESIVVNQSVLGRILNYGVIVVVGTGGTRESFHNIAGPMDFRKRINIQIAGVK